MKHILSVSLGSSKRNHVVETEIDGEKIRIERVGTDGDLGKAIELIKKYDGRVDAFGLGGVDLYLRAGNRKYLLHDAARIASAAQKTPIVDGGGLKNTLERKVVKYLREEKKMVFKGRKTLVVSAVDRFGLAESLEAEGAEMYYGDLIFSLRIPVLLRSLRIIAFLALVILPVISRLPFKYIYPTGSKQDSIDQRFARFYAMAEIIAGDFHFIRRYMPKDLRGKVIITNTVTSEDVNLLKERGVKTLITTTPVLDGRSFGTNVMEGMLVALSGKPFSEIKDADYEEIIERIKLIPRVEELN